MIAVIFEVTPHPDRKDRYLEIAASLKADLSGIDGFLSVERFQSLSDPDKILSLSFFRDEAALDTWRNREDHRAAQAEGRTALFRDYRLRIATVMRDYGMTDRNEVPGDSAEVHDNG